MTMTSLGVYTRYLKFLHWLGISLLLIVMASQLFAQYQVKESPAIIYNFSNPQIDTALQKILTQKISVRVNEVRIEKALQAAVAAAKIHLLFTDESVKKYRKLITIELSNVSLRTVLDSILSGTNLYVAPSTAATLVLRERAAQVRSISDTSSRDLAAGRVSGQVLDSVTRKGINGATVTVVGTRLSMTTRDNGSFRFDNVPAGSNTLSVKILGHRSKTMSVVVSKGKNSSVTIALAQASTTLSEVITTATGLQRRVEVGNDIATINVDSVMKVMPVSTFTELLATRVPGLTVMATSGAPGAPSRVRIRGVSSINASNDPIVIVDGIRVNSAQIENSNNLAGDAARSTDQLVSSPLDAIDPNSIETIEVFKGPSAVALYGIDASNGVIVVTTKRGKVGPPRWNLQGVWGLETMPGKWPTNYTRLGLLSNGAVVDCSSVREAGSPYPMTDGNGCSGIDGSVFEYQILNDSKTTVFGRGDKQIYRAEVRGGTRGFSYNFTGTLNRSIGYLKMPDVDVQVLRDSGYSVPSWQQRPQGSESQSGTVAINADLGRVNADFSTTLTRTYMRTTPLQKAITVASGLRPSGVSNFGGNIESAEFGSGVLAEIASFRAQTSSQRIEMRNSLKVWLSPFRWLDTEVTAGVTVSDGKDLSTMGRGECVELFGGSCVSDMADGYYNNGVLTQVIPSFRLRVSAPEISFGRWISLRPSIAGDYTRTSTNSIRRAAHGLPVGATSGNGAVHQATSEQSDDRSTAGVYGEMRMGFANRLFFPLSLRLDAGSGLGASVIPAFPRISPSFLVSDLPVFRQIPLIGRLESVRLRAAYGQSGKQPSISAKLRTYNQRSAIVDGVSVMSTEISSLGNSLLRPERKSEVEGGADIDMVQGRFRLSITGYHARTVDALISIDVPNSVNGGGNQLRNVGTVENTGMELTMNATVLQQRSLFWHVDIGMSTSNNKLVKLGRDSLLGGSSGGVRTQFVEGYPLFGQWALPVVGFADLNGDGWITTNVGLVSPGRVNEVQLGTDPVYLGAPYPKFVSSLQSTLTVLRDISIGATFNYQHGLTQKNEGASVGKNGILNRRAFNDPTTPLATQAYLAVAIDCRGRSGFETTCSNIGMIQTVSTVRFVALSVGYMLPRALTERAIRGRSIWIGVQGTNLGLWTNYSGKDPDVNASMSEVARDAGILPTARVWQFTMRVN